MKKVKNSIFFFFLFLQVTYGISLHLKNKDTLSSKSKSFLALNKVQTYIDAYNKMVLSGNQVNEVKLLI